MKLRIARRREHDPEQRSGPSPGRNDLRLITIRHHPHTNGVSRNLQKQQTGRNNEDELVTVPGSADAPALLAGRSDSTPSLYGVLFNDMGRQQNMEGSLGWHWVVLSSLLAGREHYQSVGAGEVPYGYAELPMTVMEARGALLCSLPDP